MGEQLNTINLNPQTVICGRHGELFMPGWPIGFPEFTAFAYDMLLQNQIFIKTVEGAGVPIEGPAAKGPATTRVINRLLETRPVCCWLDKDELLWVYKQVQEKVQPWDVQTCSLCHKRGPGVLYRKMLTGHPLAQMAGAWAHVCIRCVVFATASPTKPRALVAGVNGYARN